MGMFSFFSSSMNLTPRLIVPLVEPEDGTSTAVFTGIVGETGDMLLLGSETAGGRIRRDCSFDRLLGDLKELIVEAWLRRGEGAKS
jgi:hypothetical protein